MLCSLLVLFCSLHLNIFVLVEGTEGKIVGGMESNIKLWPSTVALYRYYDIFFGIKIFFQNIAL